MNEAENHGLAFFFGEGNAAHQSDNEFVQDVAGLFRTISVTGASGLVFPHRWEVGDFRGRAAAQLTNPSIQNA